MYHSKRAKLPNLDETEHSNRESYRFQTPMDLPEDLSEKKIRYNTIVTQSNSGIFSESYPGQFHSDKNVLNRSNEQRSVPVEEEFLSQDSDNPDDCMEEARQLETLEIFAKEFKQKRIKLGYTQGDVGLAIGQLYGNDFSQTTISRFEALNLSFKNMCKLRPLLERWLNYANKVVKKAEDGDTIVLQAPMDPSITPGRKRKKRTSIDQKRRGVLDEMFVKNPKPTSDELHSIAEECDLDKEVVRVWFCNRRQKEKRIAMHEQQTQEDVDSHSPPDSPCASMYPPVRIIPDSQPNFAGYTSSTTSGSLEHLSRSSASSMLSDGLGSGGQKDRASLQEQQLRAISFAGRPMLQSGNHMEPNFVHPLILSAQAAQTSSQVPPAYSALNQEQYQKSAASVLQSSVSSLLSHPVFSAASTLVDSRSEQEKAKMAASRPRNTLSSPVTRPSVNSSSRTSSSSTSTVVMNSTF